MAEIFHGIRFGNKKYDFLQFDHVFWNGDLNYRIEVPPAALKSVSGNVKFETPRALVMDLVEKRDYAGLWQMDELQREVCSFNGKNLECNSFLYDGHFGVLQPIDSAAFVIDNAID